MKSKYYIGINNILLLANAGQENNIQHPGVHDLCGAADREPQHGSR